VDIDKLKDLIAKREAVDAEIIACVGGETKRTLSCSKCGEPGHTARTCKKDPQQS